MFTLYYNQGGDSRLPFAKTVAEILGVKPKYTGVPKCAYIIDYATVTRQGNIEVDERTDRAKLVNLVQKLMERGYMTEQSGSSFLPDEGVTGEEENTPVDVEAPANQSEPQDAEPPQTAEPPQAAVLPQTTEPHQAAGPHQAAEPPQATEVGGQVAEGETDSPITTTISVPRDIFTNLGLENLKKLLWAKGELICMALDITTTDIEVTDETVSFPWFGELAADEIKYISQFISGLCEFANLSKRVTSKRHREDNPKFTMRTWLIRLGFKGPEFKGLRTFMMKRLPGDAAWRFGKPDHVQPIEPRLPVSVQMSEQL